MLKVCFIIQRERFGQYYHIGLKDHSTLHGERQALNLRPQESLDESISLKDTTCRVISP
jgi:hypothetical protein